MVKYYSRPVAVWPRSIHERMVRQQSVFVVHGGTYSRVANDIPEPAMLETLHDSMNEGRGFLVKFTVPPTEKQKIRDELRCLGIHIGSLFPELEYQAEHIKTTWKAKITKQRKDTRKTSG